MGPRTYCQVFNIFKSIVMDINKLYLIRIYLDFEGYLISFSKYIH